MVSRLSGSDVAKTGCLVQMVQHNTSGADSWNLQVLFYWASRWKLLSSWTTQVVTKIEAPQILYTFLTFLQQMNIACNEEELKRLVTWIMNVLLVKVNNL